MSGSAIGPAAEHLVRGKLLSIGNQWGIRTYRAVTESEVGFDMVIVWPLRFCVFAQVKGVDIRTRPARFSNLDRDFDVFVAVVFDDGRERYFILTKDEVEKERIQQYNEPAQSISLSYQEDLEFYLRTDLGDYEDAWWKCFPHDAPGQETTLLAAWKASCTAIERARRGSVYDEKEECVL